MSYRITHYNGSLITLINDGTVDNTLDITLVGKNYAGYGTIQNDNFVYLLENFANTTPPGSPISGQIWFDSGNKKLKFFDGNKFRTTGGAEIGTSEPSGLTIGDFWWDTANNQLHAYTGSGFALIGPQIVAGSGTTEMLTTSVKDSSGTTHSIIEAVINGETEIIISSDEPYTLDTTSNPIAGFTTIHKGITLAYSDPTTGEKLSDDRFWGTAANAERLGGQDASNFIQAGVANFIDAVNFADLGFYVGSGNGGTPKLWVHNNNATTPTIANIYNDTINFSTFPNSVTTPCMTLKGADILPGIGGTSNLGSSSAAFATVYGATFTGTSVKAQTIQLGSSSTYVGSDTAATASTVAVRNGNGDIYARYFQGTATAARYADLAEKYLPDADYDVGTVMCIGGDAEVTMATFGTNAIGVVSGNPAYMMNSDLEGGIYIALKGRVPVKCKGAVSKGDMLVPSGAGYAKSDTETCGARQFAVALESSDDEGIKVIECLVL